MPCYDYGCPECKHKESDIVQTVKEAEDNLECTKCGAIMKRIPTTFGFKIDV